MSPLCKVTAKLVLWAGRRTTLCLACDDSGGNTKVYGSSLVMFARLVRLRPRTHLKPASRSMCALSQPAECRICRGFPKLGVPHWGPYYKGILPFRGGGGLFLGVPYFRKPPPCRGSLCWSWPALEGPSSSPVKLREGVGRISTASFRYSV